MIQTRAELVKDALEVRPEPVVIRTPHRGDEAQVPDRPGLVPLEIPVAGAQPRRPVDIQSEG